MMKHYIIFFTNRETQQKYRQDLGLFDDAIWDLDSIRHLVRDGIVIDLDHIIEFGSDESAYSDYEAI